MGRSARYLQGFALLFSPVAWLGVAAAQTGYAETGAWHGSLTSDGQPDLQGSWTNDSYTPLERSPSLGDKQFYTREEAAKFLEERTDRLNAQPADAVHYDDAIWQAENYDPRKSRSPGCARLSSITRALSPLTTKMMSLSR